MPSALLCFSHLRWDFVYQRPNHLMARAARDRRVFFVEEAVEADQAPGMELHEVDGVVVVRPHVPANLTASGRDLILEDLLADLVHRERIDAPWLWYYTPMALSWTRGIDPSVVVYDCMDELTGFRGAPPELVAMERRLFGRADVVFTGGRSLYEAKARQHTNVHAVPSAVEVTHFAEARRPGPEPADQVDIPHPRIGYYGVIDERLDRDLIAEVARLRPEWQLVLVGPVAKLAPDEIPAGPNIHRLGLKRYGELPDYLRGWDVAIMPFARNEATRYISPTKTPEYLAGGKRVVSTSIRDVVEPYGRLDLVRIADTAEDFVAAVEAALEDDLPTLLKRADRLLAEMSWDATWARMDGLVRAAAPQRPEVIRDRPVPVAPSAGARTAARPATIGMPVGAGRSGTPGDEPARTGRLSRPGRPVR